VPLNIELHALPSEVASKVLQALSHHGRCAKKSSTPALNTPSPTASM
jgi:hypothetical protein